jgi:hypothetical protein
VTTRMCSYCGVYYTDEEGPHPRADCMERLIERREGLIDKLYETQHQIRAIRWEKASR